MTTDAVTTAGKRLSDDVLEDVYMKEDYAMTALTAKPAPSRAVRLARSRPVLLLGLLVCAGLLLLAMLSSIAFGAADINAATVWQ
ncbi:MAG: hypothetical protein H7Y32_17550, partial [Chloroflexales bacterium]|nr:hypothetical protein [Chloroflexales bacterium]